VYTFTLQFFEKVRPRGGTWAPCNVPEQREAPQGACRRQRGRSGRPRRSSASACHLARHPETCTDADVSVQATPVLVRVQCEAAKGLGLWSCKARTRDHTGECAETLQPHGENQAAPEQEERSLRRSCSSCLAGCGLRPGSGFRRPWAAASHRRPATNGSPAVSTRVRILDVNASTVALPIQS